MATRYSFIAIFVGLSFTLFLSVIFTAKPNGDPLNKGKTLGINVYEDPIYGCQYLGKRDHYLIKRVDKDGNHVGCR